MILLPTYHPSAINRNRFKKGGATANMKYVWMSDLAKARRLVRDYRPLEERFTIFPTLDDVLKITDDLILRKALIAVDIETNALDHSRGDILCIGVAWSEEDALVIPFFSQGGARYWSQDREVLINEEIKKLLQNCPQAYQNSLYDLRWLRAKGYQPDLSLLTHDTLLIHHAVSPELPHNLGFIVSTYGLTPYWKSTLSDRPGRALDLSDEEFRSYNARDCVVLHQIIPPMVEDLRSMGTDKVYFSESIPLVPPILKMIENGIKVSPTRLKKWKESLNEQLSKCVERLRAVASVPPAFNFASDDDLRWLLFSIKPNKFKKIADLEKKKKGTKLYAALLSLKAIRDETATFSSLSLGGGRRTDTGRRAVDKQGLLSLQVAAQNRLAQIEKFVNRARYKEEESELRRLLEVLSLITEHRKVSKLLSTYTEFPIVDDGRIHSSFKIHGTATGRLSSSEPNVENLPTKANKLLGKCFVAEKGHKLLQVDYSNLEVRILAYETGDEELIKFLEDGGNFHDENTKIMFKIESDNPKWDECRRAAKTFAFGGLAYGGGDREIYEKVILQAPTLALTFAAFKSAKARWMAAHPAYVAWREEISKGAVETRKVSNAFGRVRVLHGSDRDIVKEALNFPIQSAAASIINHALINIDKKLHPSVKIVNQIHDALLFEVPLRKLEETATLVINEMQKPVLFYDKERSFPVEAEIGRSWGELEPYRP